MLHALSAKLQIVEGISVWSRNKLYNVKKPPALCPTIIILSMSILLAFKLSDVEVFSLITFLRDQKLRYDVFCCKCFTVLDTVVLHTCAKDKSSNNFSIPVAT